MTKRFASSCVAGGLLNQFWSRHGSFHSLRKPVSIIKPFNKTSAVIEVGEELDFRNAEEFKVTCQDYLQLGARNFIIDFTETNILDSSGLGAIFSLYRNVTPQDGQIVFASVSQPVRVVIQLTHTYKVFRQYLTVEEAQDALE